MDQAERTVTTSDAGPGGGAPLLRTLGDAGAAVCTDGFCEVRTERAKRWHRDKRR